MSSNYHIRTQFCILFHSDDNLVEDCAMLEHILSSQIYDLCEANECTIITTGIRNDYNSVFITEEEFRKLLEF